MALRILYMGYGKGFMKGHVVECSPSLGQPLRIFVFFKELVSEAQDKLNMMSVNCCKAIQ
jgi:hypothetical protein